MHGSAPARRGAPSARPVALGVITTPASDPVHRRLAELQLRVLWEEILPRFERIDVQAEPDRVF